MSNLITTQINQLAERFELPQSEELYQVLKATAFKGEVTDAQLSALLIVSKQYGLNPWTKEIYAFPDKGGIVPVVGVDGWSRIINEHPQFDGEEFEYGPTFTHKNKTVHEWIECVIYRKDRSKPTRIREYFDEVNRDSATPWNSHPKRMHRHKALIQSARLAFGFGGIFDADEAERIIENGGGMKTIDPSTGEISAKPIELPIYSDTDFEKNLPVWRKLIESGRKSAGDIIFTVSSKATMTEEQIAMINATVVQNTIDAE
jgi:phage recombination protein Bet